MVLDIFEDCHLVFDGVIAALNESGSAFAQTKGGVEGAI